jgi:hypothetical protein
MRVRRFFLTLALTVFAAVAFAQKIHVKATNEPLSAVIKRMKVEVSYDSKALATYRVTVDKSFSSPYKALLYLLSGKPLQVKDVAGVYIISAKQKEKKAKTPKPVVKTTYVVRKIPDAHPVDLDVSLKEIVITARSHAPSLTTEVSDGTNRFNSFAARDMPGSSDNMVFNVLRMMPGIRASGEPSDELYVWGSSPGESRLTYDGIPLFAMQSYNSNISYINPYMFSEVRYKRGVLSADEGSQTGALVNVTSDLSGIRKPVVKAMVSTMSVNCFAALPLGKRWVATAAYRHTLEGLFGGTSFDAYRGKSNKGRNQSNEGAQTTETAGDSTSIATGTSTTITPDFKFQDLNANVSGTDASGNTLYKFTLYGAKDYLGFSPSDSIIINGDQTSYQGGASANITRQWANGNRSELSAVYSVLYSRQSGNTDSLPDNLKLMNAEHLSQFNARFCQTGVGRTHWLSAGAELTAYHVNSSAVARNLLQPTAFANARYNAGPLNIDGGLRIDLLSCGLKWQPRVALSYRLPWHLSLISSWGIYDQYLVKDKVIILTLKEYESLTTYKDEPTVDETPALMELIRRMKTMNHFSDETSDEDVDLSCVEHDEYVNPTQEQDFIGSTE